MFQELLIIAFGVYVFVTWKSRKEMRDFGSLSKDDLTAEKNMLANSCTKGNTAACDRYYNIFDAHTSVGPRNEE
jgi:hypothetical protein